ncbi:MAG: MinD/ParA family ATP-binding protein [Gemmatimonadaceae bacterium]
MPHDLRTPRVVIASGMAETGVSTIAKIMQDAVPALNVVDGGSRWADILEACTPGFARVVVVTTHDIVSVSSAYALIKLVRDRFQDASIEVLVNRSEERDALKTYERIQGAASHFLGEMVGYAGSVPEAVSGLDVERAGGEAGAPLQDSSAVNAANSIAVNRQAMMALHDLATRLDDELVPTTADRGASRRGERRMAS